MNQRRYNHFIGFVLARRFSMLIDHLTIVGVGLIGGSLGLAAKKHGLAKRVHGLSQDLRGLEQAQALGAIDEAAPDLARAAGVANVIVVCTPVDQIARLVLDLATHCRPGTLITDAGSTKEQIVAEVESALPAGVFFVGGHPLAGSEKRGPGHADAYLFHHRRVILTPTPRTPSRALSQTRALWEGLGAQVKELSPAAHDRGLALTSHLPHLLASALAGLLPSDLFDLAASGFRDTTRIAAGDPSLWTAICQHNRPAVLDALARFADNLEAVHAALKIQDWPELERILLHAKKVRDALGS